MPYKSESQERLMRAAAHTPGGYGGVPQSVGKKFEEHKDDSKGAAGILHRWGDKVLLIKRDADVETFPSTWAFPGGHIEDGEQPHEAAVRESFEEVGNAPHDTHPIGIFDSAGTTFHAYLSYGEFDPVINHESSEARWFDARKLPHPMIPSCRAIIDAVFPFADEMTEHDIMEGMKLNQISSPQKYNNVWLFATRVTGTGVAVRADGEIAYKAASDYLTDEFLARCNGLPLIWSHPDKKLLDTESFQDQIIGTSCMPYIQGDEVWTISRVYNEKAAQLMMDNQLSTSPAVVIGSAAIKHGDFLLEGKPVYLDHIAVCSAGVWDKGTPDGVRIDSIDNEVSNMDEILEKIKGLLDENNIRMDAKFDELNLKIEAIKADAKEEKEEKVKDDAEEDKLSEKEKEGVKEEIKKTEHKVDADFDASANKNDSCADTKVDSKIAALEAKIAELTGRTAELSIEDRNAIAAAQARADSLSMALGNTTSMYPVSGESALSYRKRLAAKFAQFSGRFKDVDLSKIADEALFKPVEDAVYADAFEYAKAPATVEGHVHMMESRDEAGRMVRTATANSDPRAWMGQFSVGASKLGSIRLQ